MSDTWPPTAGDDAELSAYLEGDLDDLAARRLEARLAEDPSLAARLDRLADMVAGLRGVDDVPVPEGLAERVRAHAAASLATESAPADHAAEEPVPRAHQESVSRLRRAPRRLGAVAAAVAAVALVGTATLLTSPADEEATDEFTTLDSDADGPGEQPEAEEAPVEEDADAPVGAEAEQETVEPPDTEDPRDAVTTEPALSRGESLLGMSAQDAETTAGEQWSALADGPTLPDGSDPSACRASLPDQEDDIVVPVAVEAGALDGDDVLAHLVAVGTDGPLERLEVVTVDAATCQVVDRREADQP